MTERAPPSRGQVLRFFRECVRPYLALQLEIGLCLVIGVVLALVDPLVLRAIIDRALGDGDRELLIALVALLAVILVFRVVFRMMSVWLTSYSGLRILFDLRQRAFEHVERLSPYYFRGERFGDILARLTSDIDVLQRAAAHTVVNAAQDLLTIVGILAALFWLDPWLTLVLIAICPLLAFALSRVNRRLRDESSAARASVGGLYAFLEERVGAVRLIQEFRRERAEARGHVRASRPWITHNLRLSLFGSIQVSIADLMTTGAFILVFTLGGLRALDGVLSLGTLIAYYTLATRLYRPISGLIDINIDLHLAAGSLRRIYEVLDTTPDVAEARDATEPATIEGRLEVDRASVVFDGQRVLDGVSLRLEPGSIIGLVGPSGSGKSTLAAVLARQIDPEGGRVTIDGLELTRWKLGRLRRTVGLVSQETQLFHDTLAGNLRFARPRASDAELFEVLDAVQLGPFVASLPDGLETQIGEHGMRLSGGERQRLALARALLKRPRILILDEATSALDPLTERLILDRLPEWTRGSTVIQIAHRLTTLTDVDRIYVLDHGRLVQSGTHAELLASGGLYGTLFERQLRAPSAQSAS